MFEKRPGFFPAFLIILMRLKDAWNDSVFRTRLRTVDEAGIWRNGIQWWMFIYCSGVIAELESRVESFSLHAGDSHCAFGCRVCVESVCERVCVSVCESVCECAHLHAYSPLIPVIWLNAVSPLLSGVTPSGFFLMSFPRVGTTLGQQNRPNLWLLHTHYTRHRIGLRAMDAHAELPFPRERDSMRSRKTPRPGHLAPAWRLLLPVRSLLQRFSRKAGARLSSALYLRD